MKNVRASEEAEARAFWMWVELRQNQSPELRLLYHVPNGEARSKAAAGRLKAMGVRAGAPDYALDLARGPYHGLRIELKAEGGRETQAQIDWSVRLNRVGYLYRVAVGFEAAIAVVEDYLALGPYHALEAQTRYAHEGDPL